MFIISVKQINSSTYVII